MVVIAYTGIAAVNIDGGHCTRKRGSASVAQSTRGGTTMPHSALGVRHDDADGSARGIVSSSNFRDCVLPIIDEYLFLEACFLLMSVFEATVACRRGQNVEEDRSFLAASRSQGLVW